MKIHELIPPSSELPFTVAVMDSEGVRYVRFIQTAAAGGILVFFATNSEQKDPRVIAADALVRVRKLAVELEAISKNPIPAASA